MQRQEFIAATVTVAKGIAEILCQFLPQEDDQKMTIEDIVRVHECHENTVRNKMKNYGIAGKRGALKLYWKSDVDQAFKR